MADDGMLMNFELGGGPLKPQVKFTGGSWRDRKRAEKSAKLGSRPAAEARGPDDEQRSAKRQRIDGHGTGRQTEGDLHHHLDLSRKKTADHGAPGQKKPLGPGRQVVSRLFSFNPEQKTTFEDETEWKEPEATNAPLLTVANFGSLTISSRLVEVLTKMNLERPTAIQQKVIPHLLSSSSDAFVQAETGSGKTFSYLLPILHRVLLLSGRGEQIHRDSGVFAIIVAPTRELAKQTHTVLEQLIRPFPWLVSTAITGGESKKAEKARLRKGVNFLVATPGRLADHIDNTKALNLGTVRWLILDEGDRLMDLGFEEDLKKAIDALKQVELSNTLSSGVSLEPLPDRRVTVLCSATMKMNVQKLGEMTLADATFLAAEKGDEKTDENKDEQAVHKAPAQLHQSHIIVPAKLRLVTLMAYLKSVFSRRGHTMKAIIFMSCAHTVDFHFELLKIPDNAEASQSASKDAGSKDAGSKDVGSKDAAQKDTAPKDTESKDTTPKDAATKDAETTSRTVAKAGYITSAASPEVVLHRMHGSLSQPVRTATLKSFSACKSPSLLITTDVSSRGLDIPSVDLVIEYDPAFSFDDHIHRVGRTARAGRSGDAVIFLLPGTEEGYIELLKSSGSPSSLPYESVLKKGLMSKLEFPVETTAKPQDGQTYHDKAETLQLHLEQRLLIDSKRLELARNGFKSHIRAYATHTREERVHFDITQLHLGHVAKAFGLRDPPGGIGAGIDRKAQRGKKEPWRAAKAATGTKKDDDEDDNGNKYEAKPARDTLMRKSRMLMSGASEFNIG
jgi:ATP-dependent RNA helicase DDX31/DBP7